MIKYYCDKCKKEIDITNYFCEFRKQTQTQVLIPIDKKQRKLARQLIQDIFHFCPKCADELISLCQSKDAGGSNN